MLNETRMGRQSTRWFMHYRSDIVFVCGVLLLVGATIVALVGSRAALETQATSAQSPLPTGWPSQQTVARPHRLLE